MQNVLSFLACSSLIIKDPRLLTLPWAWRHVGMFAGGRVNPQTVWSVLLGESTAAGGPVVPADGHGAIWCVGVCGRVV